MAAAAGGASLWNGTHSSSRRPETSSRQPLRTAASTAMNASNGSTATPRAVRSAECQAS